MKDSGFGSFLAGVVIGGLIGAALGLILAPQTGEELREHVNDFVETKRAEIGDAVNEGRAAAEQARADMVTDYDVASDTVGATVNAVTKSGTNEFHGSVYYVMRDADWMGELDGEDYTGFDTDKTKGLTVGGPILKDRLFFFAAYEEQTIENFGGETSDGLANGDVTQDEIDEAIAIAEEEPVGDDGLAEQIREAFGGLLDALEPG